MNDFLEYEQLPIEIRRIIEVDRFLDGIKTDDSYLLWVLDKEKGAQSELEFLAESGRQLSFDERVLRLHAPYQQKIGSLGVTAFVSYKFEDSNGVTHREVVIKNDDDLVLGSNTDPCLYSNGKSITEVSCDIFEKYFFEIEYKSWNDEQKSIYWAKKLYRLGRQTAEQGESSDILTSKLVEEIKKSDEPKIESLLRGIVKQLSCMEGDDFDSRVLELQSRGLKI